MAFSGSTDFSYTRDQLIKAALRKCRAYDVELGAPEQYQMAAAAEALNLIVKELPTSGVVLWAKSFLTIPLAKGKRLYTLGTSGDVNTVRPLRVYDIQLENIPTKEETPMNQYSRSDYQMLTNKQNTGTPANVYYDRQIDKGQIYVWPIPDDSKHRLNVTADIPLQDFDASGDTAHVPSYAYRYLVWALAVDLAPEYGVPLPERGTWASERDIAEANLLSFEAEVDGFQVVPDNGYGGMV